MARTVKEQIGVDEHEPAPIEVETPEAEQRPEWLPENFNDPEDLVKSFKDTQRELTQRAQRMSELEQQVEFLQGAFEQQPAQQQPAYDPATDPMTLAYEQAMEQGDYRTALAIQAQVSQAAAVQTYQQMTQQNPQTEAANNAFAILAEQSAAQKLEAEYGDYGVSWGSVKERVGQTLKDNPHFLPDTQDPSRTGNALYQVAKTIVLEDLVTNAQTSGGGGNIQDALRQQKLAAQTLQGNAGRPTSNGNAAADLVERMKALGPAGYGGGR